MTESARELDGTLRAGERVGGHWVVLRSLGSGGHASVYLARHDSLGHSAAIKVLHLERCGTAIDEMLGRFRREARIAALVRHANLVRVFDAGELADGSPYYVMDAIEGEDLQQRIDREGALPLAAAVDVALQCLAGVSALADHGVVHRDVKPGNLMLEPREGGGYDVRLVDFGIASTLDGEVDDKMTVEGTVLGTPEYMSPEQIRGHELDPRTDVYAVGVVLYEMLAGELPFAGKGPCATLAMALTQTPPAVRIKKPSVPEEIEDIVMRALAKDRDERWPSPHAMARALAQTASRLGIPTGADAWAEGDRTRRRARDAPLDLEESRPAKSAGSGARPRPAAARSRRPAARARKAEPTPPPEDALDREVDALISGEDARGAAREGSRGAARDDVRDDACDDARDDESLQIALPRLERQARSVGPVVARIVLVLAGIGLATALGLGLVGPARGGAAPEGAGDAAGAQ